jgi:hypothetical protein
MFLVDLGDNRLDFRPAACAGDDFGAATGEFERRGTADAGTCTGDQCDFAGKSLGGDESAHSFLQMRMRVSQQQLKVGTAG